MLLLQGGMADAALHWAPIWNLLAANYAVFAPDWPGFGGSQALGLSTFPRMVSWIEQFRVEILRADKMILIGNSFGGTLARLYAATLPERVASLILIDGGGFVRLKPMQRLFLATPIGAALARRSARRGFSDAQVQSMFAHPDRLPPDVFEAYRRDGSIHLVLRKALVRGLPRQITPCARTLVLWGNSDRLVPVDRGRAVAAEIPNAVFEVVSDAGHLPQVEQPQAVSRSISRFASGA